jgi:ribonuclease HI
MAEADTNITLRDPKGEKLNYEVHLLFSVTNNVVEYERILTYLRIDKEVGAREVNIFSDS